MREFSTVDQSQMRTRGEGVKKSQNFADVIYGWPLTVICENFTSGRARAALRWSNGDDHNLKEEEG